MRAQLSADQTWVEKLSIPALVVLVAVLVVVERDTIRQRLDQPIEPMAALVAVPGLILFGSMLRVFLLTKTIGVDDAYLYVSGCRKEIRVPLRDIAEVKQGFWHRRKYGETVSITFEKPTEFGRRVLFFPKPRSWVEGYDDHPVVADLRNRIAMSRFRHG